MRMLILVAGQSYFRGGDVNVLPIFLIALAFVCVVSMICGVACYKCNEDKTEVYSPLGGD